MYQGMCHGGPLDGQHGMSRYPQGFLLVDKPAGWCWLYELVGDNGFYVRDPAGEPVHTQGPKNRYRAADEPNYDVVAAPWVGADQEADDGD